MPNFELGNDTGFYVSGLPEVREDTFQEDLLKQLGDIVIHKLRKPEELPYSVGLFGSWGTGKTVLLARLQEYLNASKDLPKGSAQIIYFNAAKYAGVTPVFPAMAYKLAMRMMEEQRTSDVSLRQLAILFGQLGLNVISATLESSGIKIGSIPDAVNTAITQGRDCEIVSLVNSWYSIVDRVQDVFCKLAANIKGKKFVILVDELDRCDPHEAFAAIREIRSFLMMRSVPFLFVLCTNPVPIGLAVKHMYGLDTPSGDFEARRIIEKFVDSYVDTSEPISLKQYVINVVFKRHASDDKFFREPFIARFDSFNKNAKVGRLHSSTCWDVISTGNPLYRNIRLLDKSFGKIVRDAGFQTEKRGYGWFLWHLEILNQTRPDLRDKVRRCADVLVSIAKSAYKKALVSGRPEFNVNRLGDETTIVYSLEKDSTLFSAFRTDFWKATQYAIGAGIKGSTAQAEDQRNALREFSADCFVMDFLCNLFLVEIDACPTSSALPEIYEKIRDVLYKKGDKGNIIRFLAG